MAYEIMTYEEALRRGRLVLGRGCHAEMMQVRIIGDAWKILHSENFPYTAVRYVVRVFGNTGGVEEPFLVEMYFTNITWFFLPRERLRLSLTPEGIFAKTLIYGF